MVIIAAGQGSRLRSVSNEINKTLLPVNGVRLIDVLLTNAVNNGIRDVVMVIGYQSDKLKSALEDHDHNLNLEFIYNPDWHLSNGVSVHAAKKAIPEGEDFLISMSDHYYTEKLLKHVIDSRLEDFTAIVGLDFRINDIFDIDDGMKVKVKGNSSIYRIIGMEKTLPKYDAIDCGVFKCRYDFFNILERARLEKQGSLSDACNILIDLGKMGGKDIGNEFWLDIDTPEAYQHLFNILSAE